MLPAYVPCGRCGELIEVTDDDVIELLKTRPVPMFHQVCVEPAAALRRFKVTVSVSEVKTEPTGEVEESNGEPIMQESDELVTSLTAEGEGATFMDAFPHLERRLGELWTRVREHGSIIDGLVPDKPEPPPRRVLILPR